ARRLPAGSRAGIPAAVAPASAVTARACPQLSRRRAPAPAVDRRPETRSARMLLRASQATALRAASPAGPHRGPPAAPRRTDSPALADGARSEPSRTDL